MSIAEITDYTEAVKTRKEYTEKVEAERLFVLAEAISTRVAFLLSAKDDRSEDMILQPWDVYPEFFEEEHQQILEQRHLDDLNTRRKNMLAMNRK